MAQYVSNATLTADLSRWVIERKHALQAGQPLPPMPDSVGEAALKIATRLSTKSNFVHYTFRDDLVGDALLSVVSYSHNFNPEKSQNGFAYLTQVITNAFIRRITTEQTQTYKKTKASLHFAYERQSFATQTHDSRVYKNTSVLHDAETAFDFIEGYEAKAEAKKQRAKGNAGRSKAELILKAEPEVTPEDKHVW